MLTLAVAALVATLCTYLWPPDPDSQFHSALQPLMALEYLGYDGLFFVRGPEPADIDPRVVVVGFDGNSEVDLHSRWPIPRKIHADVIRDMARDGAKVIAYDVLFSNWTDKEDDKALDKALKEAGNVVLTCRLERDSAHRKVSMESPYYSDELGIDFEAKAKTGFAEVPQDNDGVVRRWTPTENFQDEWIPSFATAVYLESIRQPDAKIEVSPTAVTLPGRTIPRTGVTARERVHKTAIPSVLLDFPAGTNAFEHVFTISDVYHHRVPKGYFKDKIVFVGLTGDEVLKETHDSYATSYTNRNPERLNGVNSVEIPGVFVQAHALNALLKGAYVTELPPRILWPFLFAFAFFGLVAVRRFSNWRAPVLFGASVFCYLALTIFLFVHYRIHVPYVIPTTGLISNFERGSIRRRWASYVSPNVLDHILRAEDDLGARRMHATVLFTDLRGFTSFSEGHSPEVIVSVLNGHFEKVTKFVEAEEGTLDKFMGDGIMAVFGAPVRQPNATWHAVRAGWQMWNASLAPVEYEGESYEFKMSVGISTGPIVAGHVGSKRRHDFTVIGDPVNSASRLQAIGREGGLHIDRPTYDEVKDYVVVASLGEVEIRGKAVPMECFQVLEWSDVPLTEGFQGSSLQMSAAAAT
jgi:adenylate cyclase